jgi:hypothetical protein
MSQASDPLIKAVQATVDAFMALPFQNMMPELLEVFKDLDTAVTDLTDFLEGEPFFYTYWPTSSYELETQMLELKNRGAIITDFSCGYGPTPAKAQRLPHGADSWHLFVRGWWPKGYPNDPDPN